MTDEHDEMSSDDGVAALLRQVGAREEPSAALMEDVRRAVHGEWRTVVSQRRRRRRFVAFGLAASIAAIAVIASWALRFAAPESAIAVTVARLDGEARLQTADASRTVAVGDALAVGAVLTTDRATRLALAYGANASIRVDGGSRIERLAQDRFRLSAGAVYIDVRPHAQRHELVIETLAGEVRHLGTQYQVREADGVVDVSVREGRVEIASANGAALASAGERVRITAAGQVERGAISAQDASWDWAEATSPPFAIDDRTLAEFLDWAARETGREVAYASPEAQRQAQTLKLRGSIEGLDPDTALSAVLATTQFKRYETRNDLIGVRLEKRDD